MSDFKIVKLLDAPVQINLPTGPDFTGEYDNATSYSIGQSVSYNGSSYIALNATTGNPPPNTLFWQLLAEKGDTGPQGETGPQGPAGDPAPSIHSGLTLDDGTNPHGTTKTDIGLSNVVNADTTTTANITDSLNKRFVTDAEKTILGNTIGTNTGDQDLSGKLNVGLAVLKSDYTPAHSLLVQQSGTGSPSVLQVGSNTLVGRLSGDGSQINDLPSSDVRAMLSINNVDNTSDADKPISTAVQTELDSKLNDVIAGTNVTIDKTDPNNPIISLNGGARVGFAAKSSSSSVAASSWSIATFSNEIEDTHAAFDGTVYTIPETGMYEVSVTLVFNSVAGGNLYIIAFSKNETGGANPYIINRGIAGGTGVCGGGGSFKERFTAGDKIRAIGYCQNATSFNSLINYNSFSVYKVN